VTSEEKIQAVIKRWGPISKRWFTWCGGDGPIAQIIDAIDERVYADNGRWIHPCGESFQEPGHDAQESGDERCRCHLCSGLREAI